MLIGLLKNRWDLVALKVWGMDVGNCPVRVMVMNAKMGADTPILLNRMNAAALLHWGREGVTLPATVREYMNPGKKISINLHIIFVCKNTMNPSTSSPIASLITLPAQFSVYDARAAGKKGHLLV
jgi:hypothetical protein